MDPVAERVAASRDYDMLQGLVAAGCGAALVVCGLTDQPLALTFLALITTAAGTSWYRKRYGHKRTTTERNVVGAVISAIAIVVLMITSGFDYFQESPVLLTSLAGAALLALGYGSGLKHVGMTVWHWVVIAALAASSLLPLLGWHPGRFAAHIPLGVALIVIGLVDHARLVRIFGRGEEA